jgi:hypothetical protein
MNWGTVKKQEVKKSGERIVELRPDGTETEQAADQQITAVAQKDRSEDLNSGMELLELDFLLGVIESTGSLEKTDITMRKLCFNEVLRRQQQSEIDSYALKVYALNDNDIYGKTIQCEAMKELTLRTEHNIKHA